MTTQRTTKEPVMGSSKKLVVGKGRNVHGTTEWVEPDPNGTRRQRRAAARRGVTAVLPPHPAGYRPDELQAILGEALDECGAQYARWGQQDHRNGTGPDWRLFGTTGELWLTVIRSALHGLTTSREELRVEPDGSVSQTLVPPAGPTWMLILFEEFLEAVVEQDPERIREELIQVMAVGASWVQALDRARAGLAPVHAPQPQLAVVR